MKNLLVTASVAILLVSMSACTSDSDFLELRGSPDKVIDSLTQSIAEGDPRVLNAIVASMEMDGTGGDYSRFLPSGGLGQLPEINLDSVPDGSRAQAHFQIVGFPSVWIDIERSAENRRGYYYSLAQDNFERVSLPFGGIVAGTPVPAGVYRLMPGDLPPTTVLADPSGWLITEPESLTIGKGSPLNPSDVQGWINGAQLSEAGEAGLAALEASLCYEANVFLEAMFGLTYKKFAESEGSGTQLEYVPGECEVEGNSLSVRTASIGRGTITEASGSSGFGREHVVEETLPALFILAGVLSSDDVIAPGEATQNESFYQGLEIIVVSREGHWEALDATDYQYSYWTQSYQNQYLFRLQ